MAGARRVQHAFSKEIVSPEPPEMVDLREAAEMMQNLDPDPHPVAAVKVRSEAYDELSRRSVNEKPPLLPNGVIGQLFGIPVVIDDTIPEDPGYQIVYRDDLAPTNEGDPS